MGFTREERYLVLRWRDIDKYLNYDEYNDLLHICALIEGFREKDGKDPSPTFVCIKDTYPEYEMVWKAIEERMTKENN